jgi:diguanylate cyclase (GGDEF)-like protein
MQLRVALRRAERDPLTGVANRSAFCEQAAQKLACSRDRDVVAFVDLNGFKPINDGYGHSAGDEVLQVVAERLRHCVGPAGLVGRMGGDEFAVCVSLRGDQTPASVGERLCDVAQLPIPISTASTTDTVCLTLSVGVALSTGATPSALLPVLLREADLAMYRAKRNRSGTAVYDCALDGQVSVEGDLRGPPACLAQPAGIVSGGAP